MQPKVPYRDQKKAETTLFREKKATYSKNTGSNRPKSKYNLCKYNEWERA